MSKNNTKKIAKMVLKMFDGNIEYAYEYSIGLMKIDASYAPVASYFEKILPPKELEETTEPEPAQEEKQEEKPSNYTIDDIPFMDTPYGPGSDHP
jgi:hypothetical protein